MAENGEIIQSLRQCERKMRLAISEAAVAAEPQRLNQLVGWLADIQRIIKEADTHAHAVATAAAPSMTPRQSTPTPKQSSRDYPKFFRDGDNLVKVGWSKRLREEYTHKAPKAAVFATAAAINEAGAGRKRVVMEQIVPIRDLHGSSIVPDYQAYITLAWLRKLNFVVQHGRQGYTLANGSLNDEPVEKLWNSVPSR